MAGPYTRGYTPGGGLIYAGRFIGRFAGSLQLLGDSAASTVAGYRVPAWLSGASVGQWAQIAGAAAPTALKDFCGIALRDDDSATTLVSLAPGGHMGNYTNNEVLSLDLMADAPAWVPLRSSSNGSAWDTTGVTSAYFPDGRPAPRHTYTDLMWCPERSRFVVGGRFWGSGAVDWNKRDSFNPATGDWDAAGTLVSPSFGAGIFFGWRDPATGTVYCPLSGTAGYKWVPSTDTWSTWALSGATANVARQGMAWAPARGCAYQLCLGDNFDSGSGRTMRSATITTAGVVTAIGFNASSAYTDFLANATNIGGSLVYNPDMDLFYWYGGSAGQTQKLYVITPNATATWDMALMSVTGVTPIDSAGGVNDKLKYVSRLKTLVLATANAAGGATYFLRTA